MVARWAPYRVCARRNCISDSTSGRRRAQGVADVQAFDIAWTRDARSLVVSAGKVSKRRLILLSVDTGDVKELTAHSVADVFVPADLAPAVSPDGLKLAFARQIDSHYAALYVMPLAGGEPQRLMPDGARIAGVTWTADSRELVY